RAFRAEATRHAAAMRRPRGRIDGECEEVGSPAAKYVAQARVRRFAAFRQNQGCRCREKTKGEDRAAMRIDAAGRLQHSLLGSDAERSQLAKRCAMRPRARDRHEIAAQRCHAAQERCRIHVSMRTVVARADETGLRVKHEFGMQASYRQRTDTMSVTGPPQDANRAGAHAGAPHTRSASADWPSICNSAHGARITGPSSRLTSMCA